jgi:hypothetical protein
MNGASSVDDQVSEMCRVPTLVIVKVGTVGAVLSGGSVTDTLLLLAVLLPLASSEKSEKEYVAPA